MRQFRRTGWRGERGPGAMHLFIGGGRLRSASVSIRAYFVNTTQASIKISEWSSAEILRSNAWT